MRRLIIVIGLWWIVGLLLVGYTIPALQGYPTGKTLNPYQELYEDLLYPSVKVSVGASSGSGVVIRYNNENWILTAAHVVGDETSVSITFYNYRDIAQIETASVVITDTVKDLALLRINGTQIDADLRDKIHTAKLASRNYVPYLFTPVWVVGCSLGLPPRPSFGHITNLRTAEGGLRASASYWEISAPIVPGNSGGGVFLKDTHELIGIAVWVRVYHGQLITTMAGIVPIQTIYEFLKPQITQIKPDR